MTRRNLRKWAEAKQRREEQAAPLRGRWTHFNDGVGIFIEDSYPLYGTYCAPTTFLPMSTEPADGPLFPEGAGGVLHAILHPESLAGTPYTHTFNPPPTEYDEDGELLPPRIEPTMTITRVQQESLPAWACGIAVPRASVASQLHPLLLNHDVDRGLKRAG